MLGQRIGELRTACGWSQVELAKKLRVAKQTVSNWENENIQPSIEMLVRLSNIFGVTTDYLLGLEKNATLKHRRIVGYRGCASSAAADRGLPAEII